MKFSHRWLLPLASVCVLGSIQGARLEKALLLKAAPTTGCSATIASPPPSFTTFLTTDARAVLWFAISDVKLGDVASSEYYTPSGQFYGLISGSWDPATSAGTHCFIDTPLEIAGQAPARLTGTWKVRIILNAQILTELQFTIQEPGTSANFQLGTNLLRNPGAESGSASPNCTSVVAIPEWTSDNLTVVCAYANSNGGPDRASPGPPDPGNNFFSGGTAAEAVITQTIDLTGASSNIDANNLNYALSAYLGGWQGQNDNATVEVVFRNAAGTPLATVKIGPVLASDRNAVTGMLLRQGTGMVPSSTRSALVSVKFHRTEGSYNDSYADNVSLVFATGQPSGGGGGGGGSTGGSGQVNFIELRGGSVSGSTYSPSSEVWDTDPGNGYWILGVSNPSTSATLLNTTTAPGINLVPGTYYLYAEPTSFGTAVRITIRWVGAAEESAAFLVGSLTSAATWTRVSGASNIGLASTGLTNVNRVGGGNNANTPGGSNDIVLQLVIGASGTTVDGGSGSGGGGGGSGGGGGGGTGCNYMLSPLTQSVPGTAATGLVLVNTATGCQWTATSNASWITITAGQSGTGSGAVSYNVAANPNTTTRTGTVTIAGQTHTVTQAAGGAAACTYDIVPTSASVAAAGGSGGFALTTSAGTCTWSATTDSAAWITLTAPTSGSGSATIRYTVAANAGVASRTGTIGVGGKSFVITQAAAPAGGAPTIDAGGVVNAGSFVSSDFPNGGIAQGSFFSVFGKNLGPAAYAQAQEYPLKTSLSGVSVRVTVGSTSVDAWLYFVSATQINAVLPSNAPLGDATLTVTYNGRSSASQKIRVVKSNFGAFTTAAGKGPGIFQNFVSATETPLNTTANAAHRSQVVILWGTGLGPITAPDSMPPPAGDLPVDIQILVGGKVAKKLYAGRAPCCAGVDQIVFEVPVDAALGCYVPVQIKVGEIAANPITISLAQESRCSDPGNPFGDLATRGGKAGMIVLARVNALAGLQAGQPPLDLTLDIGGALFLNQAAGGDMGYNPALSLPPLGTCTSMTGSLDASALLGATTGGATNNLTSAVTWLDAGKSISITGPRGTIPMNSSDEDVGGSPYLGLLGGSLPLPGAPNLPPFLDGGSYTVTGPGGKDVGRFTTTFTLPSTVTWTNRDRLTEVTRRNGVQFQWSGGTNKQTILLAGFSTDQTTKASGGFMCLVPGDAGQFAVPATMLDGMPAVATVDLENSAGALVLATVPGTDLPKFTASGIDSGMILSGSLSLRTVTVK